MLSCQPDEGVVTASGGAHFSGRYMASLWRLPGAWHIMGGSGALANVGSGHPASLRPHETLKQEGTGSAAAIELIIS